MKENYLIQMNYNSNNKWIKNFFFNKKSIQKLLYLFSFLKEKQFISVLVEMIENFDFNQNDDAKKKLIEINEKLLKNIIISEYSFGYVWTYESFLVFYFKNDFEFEVFFSFFQNLEKDKNLFWISIEFFDKSIKILEIYRKHSFMRIYRDEIVNEKNKKVKKIKITKIDFDKNEFLFFLKKYNSNKIKLIVYFHTLEN